MRSKWANLGSSDDLVVGEQVVAIGNALGLRSICNIRLCQRIE